MADESPTPDRAESRSNSGTNNHGHLTLYIVVAIILGVLVALVFPQFAVMTEVGGEIFLRLLQMVVVPLVMASVMSGILGMGDVRKLGRPGGFAVLYYLSTTILAVGTGLLLVNLINPGVGINPRLVRDAQREGAEAVAEARRGMDTQARPVTWGENKVETRGRSGTSNPVTLSPLRQTELSVSLTQDRDVAEPAEARIEVSRDGATFTSLGDPLRAGRAADTYTWQRTLPKGLRQVRLVFETPLEPGVGTIRAEVSRGPPTIGDIFRNLVLMLFTDNLLASMVEMNLLPIILFSIVFAAMLTTMGRRSETINNLVVAINEALMNFIMLLMKLAPLGIFCLVAARFGKAQLEGQFLELIRVLAWYMATVLGGLAVHAFVTLPLLLWIFSRRNPIQFLGQMSQAILTAFSTASSTATLPVTMECAEMRAKVSKQSTEFVLPLGATINMDGTALYEAAAAIFIAQAYAVVNPDFELSFLQQATIAITATLAAIGAAGIPEAGLVTMLIVLNAVGLPLELIGLILPVDWLLDRFRTAVNAYGDSVGAAIVDRTFPQNST